MPTYLLIPSLKSYFCLQYQSLLWQPVSLTKGGSDPCLAPPEAADSARRIHNTTTAAGLHYLGTGVASLKPVPENAAEIQSTFHQTLQSGTKLDTE